jgi:hypothetical protein
VIIDDWAKFFPRIVPGVKEAIARRRTLPEVVVDADTDAPTVDSTPWTGSTSQPDGQTLN